ncbi:cell envelope biogenesis protein OmpA [Flavobacterium magnum]|uniref:Cell envelope biogenesis protein OmpA n=1 Tax=Flavobacterium magnum TaxID=2162713 RepID=A0A2S0RDK4_9FLAO|nr:OmpA family protein [Flavobacterium magnum]AWA29338.1 cell envelope biogenesis protein OmpA [Flavobacterium magnum]
MKKLYIVLILVCSAVLNAQNKYTEAADKLYISLEYVDAAEAYKKLVEDGKGDPYVYSQLAESYYNVFNYKEAARWYAKVIETPQDAETYYKYAQMLKADGKYEEANKQMSAFATKAPNDQRAIEFKKDPNYLPKLRSQQKLYDLKSMSINSEKSDFGAVLSADNHLYFTSARNKGKKKYGWNEEPFLDLYSSVMSADGTFGEPQAVSEINSRWHDGPATISADGNTMYFASESFKEKESVKDKKNNLKQGQVYLFKATKDGDKWGNIKEVSFNDKSYSVSNPSLSKDGKTLYFSSNMPAGEGGNDIWKVSVAADGSFGTPENLGKNVNTAGSESFPSITDDNTLFFSSDGRKGFGGLDVFMLKAGEAEAKNVGLPINSPKDDFAFSFNTVKNIGFFSSNRDGNDNLYIANPVCTVDVITTVKDALTGNTLEGARVAILDAKKNIIETKDSGANGEVVYTVDCDKEFNVQVTKDGYESAVFPVAKSKGGKINVDASLQPIEKIIEKETVVLNDIYFEYNKSNITKEGAYELDKLVQAMTKYPEMVILVKSHTDNRGSDQYNMALSDRRAKSTVQYVLSQGVKKDRISGKGYGESEPKVDCKENCTEEQHAQNRRSEFLIVKQ